MDASAGIDAVSKRNVFDKHLAVKLTV